MVEEYRKGRVYAVHEESFLSHSMEGVQMGMHMLNEPYAKADLHQKALVSWPSMAFQVTKADDNGCTVALEVWRRVD